ncbi:MAG TPA: protein kinase [Gemmatimonadales bacterium]|nr:protein kinase [Gemmatimonadales bacterium]
MVLDVLDQLQVALESRYTIQREIGHGGMAVVYLAQDLRHERTVALKVLQPRFSEALGSDRFLREIKVAARLHHPHLLPLYDSGDAGGLLYYVTPYVEGGSLRLLLTREGRLRPAKVLRLAREIADALDYAHRNQVIHRDIKPENILLEEDHAIVADFGVARAISAAADSGLTQTGILLGTPAYMSPEQATEDALDGRSDVYSLGCVIYEMLVGHAPFTQLNPMALLAARVTSAAPTVRSSGVSVPAAVDHLVARALAQFREHRQQSAAELAIALGAAEQEIAYGTPTPGTTQPVARVAALAVLPFVNLSSDPDNEFFSDGITEDLINALTRVNGLRVTSRTSVFAFKGRDQDVREIGQRLNVSAVLEGSVRRAGDRLRVTAQLTNTADGYHLWAESYDRQLADVFELQDELTRSIVNTLRPRLVGDDSGPLVLPATASVEAYTEYLKGRYFWNKRTLDGYRRGIDFFERALTKDPDYALAYTGIADCWAMLAFDYFGGVSPADGMPRAKAAALKALELDDSLAEARSPLAVVAMLYDWDYVASEQQFKRALQIKPGYFPARLWYSFMLSVTGRHEEAIELIRRTAELEPLSLIVHQAVARILHYAGRDEEALDHCYRLIEMDPSYVTAYETLTRPLCVLGRYQEALEVALEGVERSGRWSLLLAALGQVYGRMGRREEALAVVAELEAQSLRRYVPRYHIGQVYYGLRDEADAMRELERSVQEHSGVIAWAKVDPLINWLMPNDRFRRVLCQVGLEPL